MEQKYYTTGQAIQLFQKKGFSDFTEHNLIYLVANEKLKPCFFFQGVLIHSYIPSENNNHISVTPELSYEDSMMAVMDDNFIEQGDPTTELTVDFRGYVSPTRIDQLINLLKLKETNEYINQVNVIEPFSFGLRVGDKYVTAENLESDEVEFQQIQNDQTAIFQLKCEGHPLYKSGHGIEFSSENCLFNLEDLVQLLPTQPESANDYIEIQEKIIHPKVISTNAKPTKKDEFKPAVLNALKNLGIDSEAIPKYKEGSNGVKSAVVEYLKADPETEHLVESMNTFSKYWGENGFSIKSEN